MVYSNESYVCLYVLFTFVKLYYNRFTVIFRKVVFNYTAIFNLIYNQKKNDSTATIFLHLTFNFFMTAVAKNKKTEIHADLLENR